ncbi:MAG: hypothetical protein KDB69_03070 [Acidimicrobiia bacterium]|nr:hypothetical protein [Acidimicrobiia bacterium]
MGRERETDLYAPIKAFLESQGFEVKAEIGAADVVGLRGEEVVVVELKLGFSLVLLHQAVRRQQVTDLVYVAVPRWSGRSGWKSFRSNVGLCKRLGVGVITVDDMGEVRVHSDPKPFRPRKSARRRTAMLGEFERRDGDPNTGGSGRTKLVTAYRQECVRCAAYLAEHGPSKGSVVAVSVEVDDATTMMRRNVYGWFERRGHGVYALTELGRRAAVGEFGVDSGTNPG